MNIHIGEKIKKRASEIRISASELARRINTSKQNIAGIYRRASLDSQLLYDISKALSFNFFSLYDLADLGNPAEDGCLKELESLKKEFAVVQKELELVKENNLLLKALQDQSKRDKVAGKSKRK